MKTRITFITAAVALCLLLSPNRAVAQTATPSATSISVATYYNSGSGFTSAWQPGGSGGASPSSGYIIRLSAFYRDSNGTIYDLGQGSATATIKLTLAGNTFKIGSNAPCACRAVQFSPGVPVTSVSNGGNGYSLGTRSAYTLVMTVASTYDPNSPITASYQYGGSSGSYNLEQNTLVYTSAQTINYVGVRLVTYTVSSAASDFLPYSVSSNTSDSRTVTFKITGDSHTYSANLSSSTNKVIITLSQTDSIPANTIAITWSQSAPANELTFVWFYVSSTAIN